MDIFGWSNRSAKSSTSERRVVVRNEDGGDGGMSPAMTITIELLKWGITLGLSYYLSRQLVAMLNEMAGASAKGDILSARALLAKKLKRPEIETIEMNAYEAKISVDVYSPDDIDTTFEQIGGLEEQLAEVKDNIVLPMSMWKIFKGSNEIAPCPTGVLLYGRPGTGKTLTAKAIAKECNATFISIKASTVMDKWFGESDKLVTALFTLGRKLAPSVIFIDEIDTLLKKRESGESSNGSAFHSLQGAFLAEWDGLASSSEAPVLVLGATNRPMDLDKAFLRRMPVSIKMSPPDAKARVDILKKMLASEKLAEDVVLEEIAMQTEEFTGSDLREVVRVACLQRAKHVVSSVKEAFSQKKSASTKSDDNGSTEEVQVDGITKASTLAYMRPLSAADFEYALTKTPKSGAKATEYASELLLEEREETSEIIRKAFESFMSKSE
jgi:ATPase family AAA domain-containing protein 1